MSFLAALRFLTTIPLPRWRAANGEEIGRSIVYFPVVGGIIGLILVGLNWLFSLFLPPAVAGGLLIAAMVLLSGALHLEGMVDTCDGIAGHKSVEDRWRVMHDSRAGAFGVIGVVVLLLVKYLSLNSIPPNLLTAALVLMPVVSRWMMVYAIFAYPYARPEGFGKIFKQNTSWQRFTIATAITLAIVIVVALLTNLSYFYLAGLVIMISSWVTVVVLATYLTRKFAGLTGDTYGAINEVTEVCVLILVGLLAYNQWFI